MKFHKTRRDYLRFVNMDFMFQAAKVKLAELPYIGSKDKLMMEMKKYKMLAVNHEIMTKTIGHFRWHNEKHELNKLLSLISTLSPEEQELFDVDLRKLNQSEHAKIFMYGVGKYYGGLDLIPHDDDLRQVL